MNLRAARVFVRSLAEARTFYANALGLPIEAEDLEVGFLVFGAGNCQLVIEPVALDAPPEDQALVGRFTGLSFSVSDIHLRLAQYRLLLTPAAGPGER